MRFGQCWARLFLQHLRRRSLWIIRETDDRWIPRLTWNFSWLWGLSFWLSNSDSTVSTFSSVCALRLPVPRRLSTVLNFTSSLLVLFFVQLLFINSAERCNLYILADFWLKFCLIYWAASKLMRLLDTVAKIRAIFGVWFERRKVDKKANLHDNWNMQTLF